MMSLLYKIFFPVIFLYTLKKQTLLLLLRQHSKVTTPIQKILLATVSNDRFAVGTAVMLYSMKEHLKDFSEYPITIFTDDSIDVLSQKNRNLFQEIAPQVTFENIENEVYRTARCKPEHHRLAYLTLEVFKQTQFEKVVFFDGDMIVLDDFSEVLQTNQALFGCKVKAKSEKTGLSFTQSINTGFFGVSKELLNAKVYNKIISVVQNRNDKHLGLLDQKTINKFRKSHGFPVYIIDYYCNYRDWEDLDQITEDLSKIKILHYSGYDVRPKPWEPDRVKELGLDDHPAYKVWNSSAQSLIDDYPSAKGLFNLGVARA